MRPNAWAEAYCLTCKRSQRITALHESHVLKNALVPAVEANVALECGHPTGRHVLPISNIDAIREYAALRKGKGVPV